MMMPRMCQTVKEAKGSNVSKPNRIKWANLAFMVVAWLFVYLFAYCQHTQTRRKDVDNLIGLFTGYEWCLKINLWEHTEAIEAGESRAEQIQLQDGHMPSHDFLQKKTFFDFNSNVIFIAMVLHDFNPGVGNRRM